MSRCIAFRESRVNQSVIYAPCGLEATSSRFCRKHDQAYREIFVGILNDRDRRLTVKRNDTGVAQDSPRQQTEG